MDKKILIIGAGGHCKSVLDSLLNFYGKSEVGIIDNQLKIGETILGVEVIGTDEDLPMLYKRGCRLAFVGIGSVGNPITRVKLFNELEKIGFQLLSVIDKSAVVSKFSTIGDGVFIGKGAVVNSNVQIGKGAIINTGAIVEHDCSVGDFVHISSGAVLCGAVTIKNFSHIGAKAVVRQELTIGENSIIGIGSVVVTNIKDNVTAYGCPCKEVVKK